MHPQPYWAQTQYAGQPPYSRREQAPAEPCGSRRPSRRSAAFVSIALMIPPLDVTSSGGWPPRAAGRTVSVRPDVTDGGMPGYADASGIGEGRGGGAQRSESVRKAF